MPEKTKQVRAKRAKAKGTTRTLKASDTGDVGARSAHGAKKSRGVTGRAKTADRAVSRRRPPGEGKTAQSKKLPAPETGSTTSRRRTLPAEAARCKTRATEPAAAYRSEERPKKANNEAEKRQATRAKSGSPVKGRKKPPSQLGVTRRGGPKKRLPLHGG